MRTLMRLTSALAALMLIVAVPTLALAKEEVKIKATFEALNDSEASGKLRFKAGSEGADFQIKLSGLADTDHTLVVDDIERASFAGSDGKVSLSYATPEKDGKDLLTFDPRDGDIVIRDAEGTEILTASLDDTGRGNTKEQTELEPTELADEGTARARFDHRPNGKERLVIHLIGAPVGDYQILFDDVQRAAVTTNSGGNAKATFKFFPAKSNKGKKPKKAKKSKPHNQKGDLDFDGLDAFVEIVRGEDLYWSGPLRAQVPGLNVCDPEMADTALERNEVIAEGDANASFAVGAGCVRDFDVDVAGVAAGLYQVVVAGDTVGEIEVIDLLEGGALAFSTDPEGDDLPLAFDPLDVAIEIRQLEAVLFTGSLSLTPAP